MQCHSRVQVSAHCTADQVLLKCIHCRNVENAAIRLDLDWFYDVGSENNVEQD